jgi:serine phosphatase RsbU (regulator of sigma subunit)
MRSETRSNPADLSALDGEVLERFEQGRARLLRRRLVWYCIVMFVLLGVSLYAGIAELRSVSEEAGNGPLRAATVLELAGDLALAILYGSAMVYALGRRPGRNQLVTVITWLTIMASCVVIVVAPMAQLLSAGGEVTGARIIEGEAFTSGLMGLLSIATLHGLASLLIVLTPRESGRIFVPIAAVYVVAVLFLYVGDAAVKAVLIGLLPLAAVPGVLWSWWRYKRYRETSRTEILHGRYNELAFELASARQIHEALFPPPIERGPYRMAYRYEPKREIGGDFLFVHPLAFPPSEVETPLSIVVIDVTGHGVSAALAVNRLHGELRRVFAEHPTAGAGEVMEALNAYTYEHLAVQGMFATAICMRLSNGVLQWASAGHPAALLRRGARGNGMIERLRATATMLGVLEPELYQAGAKEVAFGGDDVLVALTDGAVEAVDERGRTLEVEGIERALAAAGHQQSAASVLMEAVRQHRGGVAVDDTLIVEIRPHSA